MRGTLPQETRDRLMCVKIEVSTVAMDFCPDPDECLNK